MTRLDLAAENYDDIPLHAEVVVDALCSPIQCESHDGEVLEVTLEPPFRYLGVGRDKVVVSGLVHGLDAIVGEFDAVNAAIALARKNHNALGFLSSSLHGYRRLREHVPTAPTYTWYLASKDEQFLVMPNLTKYGAVVTAQNDRILSPEKTARLEAAFDDLMEQLIRFIDELPAGLVITFDTYFAVLEEASSRLFLGDFDNTAIQYSGDNFPAGHTAAQNRRQAEHWIECIQSYLPTPRNTYDFQCWVHQDELPPL
ncbi:MAG: hypothetical protein UV80_C0008G0036 [Candidatus Peregrinibacteria bacterium GW2011_GWF2_43_17]|nr:MAG: hypothetical protein UV80_C0008G0036 [Candidatus Peregrinibacteria bacterium GW2011_GWF2_43_17]KKT18907.1 MAG: hypothetical protein UW03_C0028G0023 [Candidatus Peregrinibacteria bacterium GW2011_GWA2_43_8]HAU39502.1 hypothetical protein [Candidatus Peregrinibacteria bacterium]